MDKGFLDRLLEVVSGKKITIIGHDVIDIDSALSGILLSKLFDFLGVKNQFCILEEKEEKQTFEVVKKLTGIDLRTYMVKGEAEGRNLFLVDHNETRHSGKLIGFIDHHLSLKGGVYIGYNTNASAAAYLIYKLMKVAEYPIDREIALMVVTAMMSDTICFKSTKASSIETQVAKDLSVEFNLNWDEIKSECLCLTPVENMDIKSIVNNGLKMYEYSDNCKKYDIRSSYVQILNMIDEETIFSWLNYLHNNLEFNSYHMHVFLIHVIEEEKTYEYQITREFIKEIIHKEIVSRGKNIMPRIEKRFSGYASVSDEIKISEIISCLSSSDMKLATMESCTGGQLASDITSVSNASEILQESYVTYSNEAKIKLGVPKEVIEKYSVYSYETAVEMSKAVSKFANVDVGISITGQIGRVDPNNLGISDNQVWYAIYINGFCFTRKLFIIRPCTRAEKKKIITSDIIETLYSILK